MKFGEKGAHVVQLQQALISLGYDLPRFGPDGTLGEESLEAFGEFMDDHDWVHVNDDGDDRFISDKEAALLYRVLRDETENSASSPIDHDARAVAGQRFFERWRKWSEVTGFVLHQTACDMTNLVDRWKNIGCHLGLWDNAEAIWLHDFDKQIVHANQLNTQCVGLEINGLFNGLIGKDWTRWDDPSTRHRERESVLTEPMVLKGQAIIRWSVKYTRDHGGNMRALLAHRQSSDSRRHDPGEEIWERIARPMMQELGLKDGGRDFKVGSGRPIPEEWNPAYSGNKY